MSDEQTYKQQVTSLQAKMDGFTESLNRISADMKAVRVALLGSEFGGKGIVKRIAEAEEEIEDLKSFKNKVVAYAIGVSVGSGAAAGTLINLLFG